MRTPPRRPGPIEEYTARWLLALASPRLGRRAAARPSARLGEPRDFSTSRRAGAGWIEGSLFVPPENRGVVVFLPPWVPQGGSWFYRHGRVDAVVAAGFSALVVDLPGVRRGGRGRGFFDREVEVLLNEARELAGSQPLHLWAVSSGAYWAHFALARSARVDAAVFEDVAVHLLLWAHREAPQGRHFYRVFQRWMRRAWPYLDLRAHASSLAIDRGLWISGDLDRGVLADETRELAARAGGEALIVPGAGHLGAIRVAPEVVVGRALELFEKVPGTGDQGPGRRLRGEHQG